MKDKRLEENKKETQDTHWPGPQHWYKLGHPGYSLYIPKRIYNLHIFKQTLRLEQLCVIFTGWGIIIAEYSFVTVAFFRKAEKISNGCILLFSAVILSSLYAERKDNISLYTLQTQKKAEKMLRLCIYTLCG